MTPILHLHEFQTSATDSPVVSTSVESHERFTFSVDGRTWIATYMRAVTSQSEPIERSSYATPNLLLDVTVEKIDEQGRPTSNAAVIRLLPNVLGEVEAWRATMNTRIEEARKSIRREGVLIETWFLFHLFNQDYLFAYMQSGGLGEPPNEPNELQIDMVHQDFKKFWDRSLRIRCERLSTVGSIEAGLN